MSFAAAAAAGAAVQLPWRRRLLLGLVAATLTGISQLTPPADHPNAMIGLAVVLTPILLWALQLVPAWVGAVALFAIALPLQLAPPITLLSGFWSNAAMLSFAGLIIGTAAERSGLGLVIARAVMRRFLGTYPSFLFGILIGTSALSFIIPTTLGRLAIAIPVVAAAARAAGYATGSNGFNGALLLTIVGNFLTSNGVLTANLVGVIASGVAETLYNIQVRYGEYFLLCAPVLFFVKGLSIWGLTLLLFPAPAPHATDDEPVAFSPGARRLAVVMGLTIALWATDFLHGLKPGWVGLMGAVLCFLPPLSLVRPKECLEINKLTVILTLAAVLGVATVLGSAGTGDMIAKALLAHFPLEGRSAAVGFATVAAIGAIMSILATTVGSIAVVIPILASVAVATGLSYQLGLVAEVTGLQAAFFPFQTVPIMVGLMMAKMPTGPAIRLMLPAAITGILIIVPLQIGWLKLIGALP
jgi:di/tricarboxylate transporter